MTETIKARLERLRDTLRWDDKPNAEANAAEAIDAILADWPTGEVSVAALADLCDQVAISEADNSERAEIELERLRQERDQHLARKRALLDGLKRLERRIDVLEWDYAPISSAREATAAIASLCRAIGEEWSPCVWTEDDDGNWQTACGNAYILTHGTPAENQMRWCCYCGAALHEQRVRQTPEATA